MSNIHSAELIKAVRAGVLSDVVAALAAGADSQCSDDHGNPGLPLRMASFNGFNDIIRALVAHGASVNVGAHGTTPIALAVRGGRRETVRLLIELGAEIPSGLQTGLSLQEVLAAQGVAHRQQDAETPPPRTAIDAGNQPTVATATPDWALTATHVEEIDMRGAYGVDTNVLDADLARIASHADSQQEETLEMPALDFGPLDKLKFWKKKD